MNRLSFLFVLGLLSALIVGGLAGYITFSKSSMGDDMKKYDLKVANLESQVVQYEGENLEAAVSAKAALDSLKGEGVKWSEVIEKILAVTPKNSKTRIPVVEYTSYSGSGAQGNRIVINARTIPGSAGPFSDVAELIRSFTDSNYFDGAFVPSISTGFSDDGDLLLVFSFNVEYLADGGGEVKAEAEKPATPAPAKPETSAESPTPAEAEAPTPPKAPPVPKTPVN